jgi:hypothetical protein
MVDIAQAQPEEGQESFVADHKQKMENCSEEFQQITLLLIIFHDYNFVSTRLAKADLFQITIFP